jgi:hypothetical protein
LPSYYVGNAASLEIGFGGVALSLSARAAQRLGEPAVLSANIFFAASFVVFSAATVLVRHTKNFHPVRGRSALSAHAYVGAVLPCELHCGAAHAALGSLHLNTVVLATTLSFAWMGGGGGTAIVVGSAAAGCAAGLAVQVACVSLLMQCATPTGAAAPTDALSAASASGGEQYRVSDDVEAFEGDIALEEVGAVCAEPTPSVPVEAPRLPAAFYQQFAMEDIETDFDSLNIQHPRQEDSVFSSDRTGRLSAAVGAQANASLDVDVEEIALEEEVDLSQIPDALFTIGLPEATTDPSLLPEGALSHAKPTAARGGVKRMDMTISADNEATAADRDNIVFNFDDEADVATQPAAPRQPRLSPPSSAAPIAGRAASSADPVAEKDPDDARSSFRLSRLWNRHTRSALMMLAGSFGLGSVYAMLPMPSGGPAGQIARLVAVGADAAVVQILFSSARYFL